MALALSCLFCAGPNQSVLDQPSKIEAHSVDGVPIAFGSHGSGETTLMFVHGWSCDRNYWKNQVDAFSDEYQVVLVDLAGHGDSGVERQRYTMKAFAQDVLAVANATAAKRIVLIGHSMGGGVIAEAARLMPERVVAIIGIDTLHDVSYMLKPEELQGMVQPFQQDFVPAMEAFVGSMLAEGTAPQLAEWIKNDMSSAPPDLAVSAFEEYLGQHASGEAAAIFEDIAAPVHCLNGTAWPTSVENNRKHIKHFDVTIMEDVGHFPMLEKPAEFNRHLARILKEVVPSLNP
ncbi:alpha/beta fold hydrolase [Myxococcota bacterium]